MKKHEEDEFDRATQEVILEEDRRIEAVLASTPETRKEWTLDDWIYGLYYTLGGLIYESDCPVNDFTPEHWCEIITWGCGVEAQFCPCREEVLKRLTRESFRGFGSNSICMLLALDGEWLAHLLPLEDIEQDDFDDFLVCDPDEYETEEDFLLRVGAYFPGNVIPPHLDYPHKEESRKK